MRESIRKNFIVVFMLVLFVGLAIPAYATGDSETDATAATTESKAADGKNVAEGKKVVEESGDSSVAEGSLADKEEENSVSSTPKMNGAGQDGTADNTAAVAEYNGQQFETLQAALDAAEEGGEVKLLKDISESVSVKHDGTDLNLNGHTLTIPEKKKGIVVLKNGAKTSIQNVTIRDGLITGSKVVIAIDTNCAEGLRLKNLKITDMNIDGGNGGVDIYRSDAVMENCTIDNCSGDGPGSATSMVEVNSATLTMKGCTITNCYDIGSPVNSSYVYSLKTSSTLTMEGCRITGNAGNYSGGLEVEGSGKTPDYWGIITLKDTVITDNTARQKSYPGGGMTLRLAKLRMTDSAIYGNHIPEDADMTNSGPDIYVYKAYTNMTISAPADMRDGEASLDGFIWYDTINGEEYEGAVGNGKGTYLTKAMGLELRKEPVKVARNMRTEEQYKSLSKAVEAAQAGDTIQLCALENEGGTAVSESTEVLIDKNLTLDLNGHDLNRTGSGGKLLKVNSGIKFSITGGGRTDDKGKTTPSEVTGTIENHGALEIAGSLSVKTRIQHRGNRLFMTGDHQNIPVSLDKGKYIEADSALEIESLKIYLLDAGDKTDLNDRYTDSEDILLLKGGPASLAGVINVPEIDNPHVRIIHKENGDKGEGTYLVDRIPTGIYLDGKNGDDEASGAENAPVKTFSKAKELLEKMITEGKNPDGIYVKGTVSVTGEESWSLPDETKLIRHEACGEDLIKVTGNLTLKDIVIDGFSEGGVSAESPLVNVDGGTLTLEEGAVLRNNINASMSTVGSMAKTGGALVGQNNASIVMRDGKITGNEAGFGGGIGLYTGASLAMSGGEISNNRALNKYHDSYIGASGGGVFLSGKTSMELSGGRIAENKSEREGGGISLGGHTTNSISPIGGTKTSLIMNGGTIEKNYAKNCGGGIFVQVNCEATVTEGDILENTARNAVYGFYSGGGIYVNCDYSNNPHFGYPNGILRLDNVEITDNTAAEYGGGFAACPESNVKVEIKNGSVIYENSAKMLYEEKRSDDVFASIIHGSLAFVPTTNSRTNPIIYLSEYMLNGAPYLWKGTNDERYDSSRLQGTNNIAVYNDYTAEDPDIKESVARAQVHIKGNYASRCGGGIGTNGDVFIGEAINSKVDIPVEKKWNDGNLAEVRPSAIRLLLLRDGKEVTSQVVKPDSDGEWKFTFRNQLKYPFLEDGEEDADHPYEYTVVEDINYEYEEGKTMGDQYASELSGSVEEGFVLTNSINERDISVKKVWDDDDNKDKLRPESIEVQLMADGENEGEAITLKEENEWTYTWEALPIKKSGKLISYTVKEIGNIEGYTSKVTGDAKAGFTITNTHKPEEPTEPTEPTTPTEPTEPTIVIREEPTTTTQPPTTQPPTWQTEDEPQLTIRQERNEEEEETTTTSPANPSTTKPGGGTYTSESHARTGDNGGMPLMAVLCIFSIIGIAVAVIGRRRHRSNGSRYDL